MNPVAMAPTRSLVENTGEYLLQRVLIVRGWKLWDEAVTGVKEGKSCTCVGVLPSYLDGHVL